MKQHYNRLLTALLTPQLLPFALYPVPNSLLLTWEHRQLRIFLINECLAERSMIE